jgi:hypothetical protein
MTEPFRETRYPPHVWTAVAAAAVLAVVSSACLLFPFALPAHAIAGGARPAPNGFQLGPASAQAAEPNGQSLQTQTQ